MDKNERKAQTAVGLEKEFRVTITVPVSGVVRYTQHVKAVSERDAHQRVVEMWKMKTDSQKHHDIFPASPSRYNWHGATEIHDKKIVAGEGGIETFPREIEDTSAKKAFDASPGEVLGEMASGRG